MQTSYWQQEQEINPLYLVFSVTGWSRVWPRMTNEWGTGYLISSSVLVVLLSLFRVFIIKWISKGIDYSIAIFCNVKYVDYENPTIQTLILLPPQWHHLFYIRGVDYLIYSLFFQLLPLFIFDHVGVFYFISSCCPNWNIMTRLCSNNLLAQIGMFWPYYDLTRICHHVTTHIFDTSVINCLS